MIWIINTLALNLTIVFCVEISLGFLFRVKGISGILNIALINILTNPTVVLSMLCVSMFLNPWERLALSVLEIMVIFLEGFLFSKFKPFSAQKPYLISLVLNLSSFLIGLFLGALI